MTAPKDFAIGAVSRLTGISQHTLRIWERRYGIEPSRRSGGGRRLYSGDDVERLTVLKALVDRGDRIGKIAAENTNTLRERLEAFADHSRTRNQLATGTRDLAVFGETFASALQESPLSGSRVVLAESDFGRFQADIALSAPDVLLLELPFVNPETLATVANLQQAAGTNEVLVIYGFGRTDSIDQLVSLGIKVLRAPANRYAIARLLGLDPETPPQAPDENANSIQREALTTMQAPARKLSQQALQRLGKVATTVECECPHHLVDLVRNLSAFEQYSRQCQNSNAEDAALHAYLHVTTANARALMEDALIRAAEADGIEY